MAAAVKIAPDLYIGKENPQREQGSRILNAWLADRKLKEASANVSTSGRKQKARNYAGASSSRLNSGWGSTAAPASWHIWQGLRALRSRSREQARNNDYARKFVNMCKDNIVGHAGIKMQSLAQDFDGTPDKLARDAIESAWKDWSRAMHCDVTGRTSLTQMLQLIIATVAVDGECLVRRVTGGHYAFQLQLIDPELLDIRFNETRANGVHIRMGVETDKHGKAVAYHLLEGSNVGVSQSGYNATNRIRVPADEIIHLYLPEAIDQVRGVPWMASALISMKHLGKYIEAAVVNARIGASKMGFFTSMDGEGTDALADDETDEGEFIQDAEPGAMEVLPEGYDFKSFNPDYPHQQFGDFVKQMLRSISSGTSVGYNSLGNDGEGVSYSTMRTFALEEREHWKTKQAWLVDALMLPLFEAWLDVQLAIGTIRVPTETDGMRPLPANRFEKFRNISFQPRRWAWVDPAKEMVANQTAIELGLKSRSEIIRDMGRDPDEVWAEIEKENTMLKDFGLGGLTGNSQEKLMEAAKDV